MLDFAIYLTVRSVEQLNPNGPPSAVLVKTTQRPFSRDDWRGGDATLFFVRLPGHAPTPGDVLKVTVEIARDVDEPPALAVEPSGKISVVGPDGEVGEIE